MNHGDTARLIASVSPYKEFYELILACRNIRDWGRTYGWYCRLYDVAELFAKMEPDGGPRYPTGRSDTQWAPIATRIAELGMYRVQMSDLPMSRTPLAYGRIDSALLYTLGYCVYTGGAPQIDLVSTIFTGERMAFPQWLTERENWRWIGSFGSGVVGLELSKLFLMSGLAERLIGNKSWGPFLKHDQFESLIPLIRKHSPVYGLRIQCSAFEPHKPQLFQQIGISPNTWISMAKSWAHSDRPSSEFFEVAIGSVADGKNRRRLRAIYYRRTAGTYMRKGEPTAGRYTDHPDRYWPA